MVVTIVRVVPITEIPRTGSSFLKMAAHLDLTSRIKGSILGVAVADALGSPVEFHPRGSFPKVVGMLYNTNFGVPAG